jgi:hypothetical protein
MLVGKCLRVGLPAGQMDLRVPNGPSRHLLRYLRLLLPPHQCPSALPPVLCMDPSASCVVWGPCRTCDPWRLSWSHSPATPPHQKRFPHRVETRGARTPGSPSLGGGASGRHPQLQGQLFLESINTPPYCRAASASPYWHPASVHLWHACSASWWSLWAWLATGILPCLDPS